MNVGGFLLFLYQQTMLSGLVAHSGQRSRNGKRPLCSWYAAQLIGACEVVPREEVILGRVEICQVEKTELLTWQRKHINCMCARNRQKVFRGRRIQNIREES